MTGAPDESPPNPREVVIGAVFVAVSIAIVAIPRFLYGPVWGDEGFLAFGAERVLHGEIPNRDFVSLQPPLSFYAVAAAFATFGTNLVVLRALGLALALAVGLAAYALSLQYARPAAAALATAPLAVYGLALQKFVPFAVWFGVLFCLLSGAALLASARHGKSGIAAGAGFAAALALLSRHDQGFYLCLASALFLALRLVAERSATVPVARAWIAGLAAAAALPLALWLATDSFAPAFDQLVTFPLTRYAATSAIDWPRFAPDGGLLPTLFYYVPAVAAAALALALLKSLRRDAFPNPRAAELGFLLALTVLFYAQVATRSDLFHLVIALPPCFVGLAIALEAGERAVAGHAPAAVRLVAGVLTSLAISAVGAPYFLSALPAEARPVDVPRGGLRLSEFEAQQIERLVGYVERRVAPDASILALPYQPIFNFVSDRRSPTRWLYLWPGDQTAEDHARLIAEAEADPPALVILDAPQRLRRSAPAIVDWVEAHYAPIATVRSSVYFAPR